MPGPPLCGRPAAGRAGVPTAAKAVRRVGARCMCRQGHPLPCGHRAVRDHHRSPRCIPRRRCREAHALDAAVKDAVPGLMDVRLSESQFAGHGGADHEAVEAVSHPCSLRWCMSRSPGTLRTVPGPGRHPKVGMRWNLPPIGPARGCQWPGGSSPGKDEGSCTLGRPGYPEPARSGWRAISAERAGRGEEGCWKPAGGRRAGTTTAPRRRRRRIRLRMAAASGRREDRWLR